MSIIKTAIVAALMAGSVATSVSAAGEPNAANCMTESKEAKASLENHQQAASYDQAKKAVLEGRQFCGAGLYEQGLRRLADAKQLLDGSSAGSASGSE